MKITNDPNPIVGIDYTRLLKAIPLFRLPLTDKFNIVITVIVPRLLHCTDFQQGVSVKEYCIDVQKSCYINMLSITNPHKPLASLLLYTIGTSRDPGVPLQLVTVMLPHRCRSEHSAPGKTFTRK